MTTDTLEKDSGFWRIPGMQLLKARDFSLLFWGQMTSQIGDSLNRVALLWFVYQLTGSAAPLEPVDRRLFGSSEQENRHGLGGHRAERARPAHSSALCLRPTDAR